MNKVSFILQCRSVLLDGHKNKPDTPVATVPKKDVIILLPYLGLPNVQIIKRLKSCVSNFYSFVNLKIIFQNTRRIKSFFPYKDRLNRSQRSKVIYKLAAGTAMMFILVKQNDDFTTGKLNILRPSLKAIIYQLSLIISLPRAITSNGIILTF